MRITLRMFPPYSFTTGTATAYWYTLSLHDALPIFRQGPSRTSWLSQYLPALKSSTNCRYSAGKGRTGLVKPPCRSNKLTTPHGAGRGPEKGRRGVASANQDWHNIRCIFTE